MNKFVKNFILILICFTALQTQASFTVGKTKATSLDNDSSLKGFWTFDGQKSGVNYIKDSTSNNNIATTSNVTFAPGKVGQAMAFNVVNNPPTQNGLVGWWNMDQNRIFSNVMTDLSSTGDNGTLSGTTKPSIVTGKYGQALSFDGSTSYVDIPDNAALKPSNMTVSAWVNVAATSQSDKGIAGKYPYYDLAMSHLTAGKLIFDIWISGALKTVESTTIPSVGQWYHVAGTYDGSNMRIYVNGVLENTTVQGGTVDTGTNTANIGRYGTSYFNGSIDDVRIYNRALSASEIADIYRGSSYAQVSPSPISTGLDTFTNTGLSVGTWVKFASSTAPQIFLRKSDTATSSNAYQLGSNGTNFQFLLGTTTSRTITGTTAIVPNKWYYVAGVADGTNMRLYVNGTQEASATQSGTTINTLSPTTNNWGNSLFLGSDDTPSNFFTGWLDEPRVYSRALSASEINKLYQQGQVAAVEKIKTIPLDTDSGLKGYWTFDQKDLYGTQALDRSGNGINMAKSGIVNVVAGKVGQAMNFGGAATDDYNVTSTTLNITTALTMCAWVKTFDTGGAIFNRDNVSNQRQYSLLINGGVIDMELFDSGYVGTPSAKYMSDGSWHHVCGTYKQGDFGRVYVDGLLNGTSATTIPNALTSTSQPTYIGSRGSDFGLAGVIDDARIYNRQLSAAEVYSIYSNNVRSVTVAKPKTAPINLNTNLVGWWTFDGKDCGTGYCIDKSSNNGMGSLTGTLKVPGKIGQSLSLNGTSDYMSVASTTIGNNLSAMTFSAWFKHPSVWVGTECISYKGVTAGTPPFAMCTALKTAGYLGFRTKNATTYVTAEVNTTTIKGSGWHLATGVYDGTNTYFYLDGVQVDKQAQTGTLANTSENNLILGASYSGSFGNYFNGQIDDVRVYNRALSSNEVYQLYRLGQ